MPNHNFHNAVADNNLNAVKDCINNEIIEQDSFNFGYYLACSEGFVEIVKTILSSDKFTFDEALAGCTVIEYGIQAACHKEGRKVLNYFIKNYDITLSPSMERWLDKNSLDNVKKKIMKIK